MSDSLEGLVVIVTGAGSGIGRETAILAARAGSHVVATDIKGADETAAAITDAGGSADARHLDISRTDDWQSVTDATLAGHGKIDGLCNVAGIVLGGADTAVDLSEEQWERIIAVNLKGTWLGMRAVLPSMIANGGGRIVNTSAGVALFGIRNMCAYTAAKSGVVGMTRQVAIECAAQNVKVNSVAPKIIDTPILASVDDQTRERAIAMTPTKRLGKPEDLARAMIFLLGPGGDFITGQTLAVDGGLTAA
jgi:NAD(P)-dependent dehydrogenase (short-subunit alcohol dehydrogenase family)